MVVRSGTAAASSAALVWSTRSQSWVSDLIAIGMPVILIGAALSFGLVCLVAPSWRVVPLVLVCTSGLLVYGPRLPQRTPAPFEPMRLASVNLRSTNETLAEAVEAVLALHADVVVVSELTVAADDLMSESFDFRVLLDVAGSGSGLGVYSLVPLVDLGNRSFDGALIRVRVEAATPFVLYATHLPRPGFGDPAGAQRRTTFELHRDMVAELDRLARMEADEPVIIAGDLNLSDRTVGYRMLLSGRRDVARSGWASSSYLGVGPRWRMWRMLLLRIDHVFVPHTWCVAHPSAVRLAGSDHRGVVGDAGPCTSPAGASR